MINLVGNAIKFTERGEVALEASVEPAPVVPGEDADPSASPLLRIAVTDTGIGIPDEHQRVIFEEFRQADGSTSRRYGGTGLGLSISARLVQMLGGAIRVASTRGRGARSRSPCRCAAGTAWRPCQQACHAWGAGLGIGVERSGIACRIGCAHHVRTRQRARPAARSRSPAPHPRNDARSRCDERARRRPPCRDPRGMWS